jgi:hypothetical protein
LPPARLYPGCAAASDQSEKARETPVDRTSALRVIIDESINEMELASIREAGDLILAEESEAPTCHSDHFLVEHPVKKL